MIDKNKIAKAARKCLAAFRKANPDGYSSSIIDIESNCLKNFKDGAKWAINEFLKNLWHPASEAPREFAEVLAEAKITESIKTYISFKRNDALFKNWDAYSSGANITRWLYIDDLFPKEGGE